MITVKEKIRLVEACFGQSKLSNDNKNIIVFCPVCKSNGKDKFKLAIGVAKGMYHCWVCEAKGYNIGRLALKYAMQKKSATELFICYKKDSDDATQIKKENIATLPEDFKLIMTNDTHEAKSARSYLTNRGFKSTDIEKFRLGISNKYNFKNRVIFPSFDKDQDVNFFTARSTIKQVKKRYYNCSAPRKNIIFREFDIDFNKTLIITEGVFDLLHTPENSTCLLGSWISEKYKLFHEIIKHKTPIVLCLDYDAISKTQKIAKSLYSYNIDVKISQHQGKDFGDMSKKAVEYYIRHAKPYDNVDRMTYLINRIHSGSIF
jgi:DNA primase